MEINKWCKYAITAVFLLFLLVLSFRGSLLLRPHKSPEPEGNGAGPKEMRLALSKNSALYIPLYAAINEGFFTNAGLAITLKTASSPDEALAWLMSGDCDVMLGNPETAFHLTQQAKKTHLIHIAQAASATGYFVVARNMDKPFTWQDLKGKIVIATNSGELPAIIFNLILRENNLRPLHDVHIIHNLPQSSVQAVYQSGTGHYLLASEPLASKMEKENNCYVVAALEPPSGQLPTSTFMVTPDFRQNKHENCQDFVNAFQAGLSWTQENTPEDIVSATQDNFPGVDAKTLLRAVSRYKNLGCWPPTAVPDNMAFERLQDVLFLENELLTKTDLKKSIDTTFAQKALENKQ